MRARFTDVVVYDPLGLLMYQLGGPKAHQPDERLTGTVLIPSSAKSGASSTPSIPLLRTGTSTSTAKPSFGSGVHLLKSIAFRTLCIALTGSTSFEGLGRISACFRATAPNRWVESGHEAASFGAGEEM